MIESLFWISAAAITYTYLGYPIAIWVMARLRERRILKAEITPRVSVVIACHNEERNIGPRTRNLLDCDYPSDRLEIIIVSDGSTDGTAGIAGSFGSDVVRVKSYEDRRGKASALNLGVRSAAGEIIVFADARQWFEPGAIKALAANFGDPRVGVVSGELLLDGGSSPVSEGVGLYWKYEKWIRKNESRAGSMIGATGAIYAIRRELWQPLPDGTILDDVYTPMRIALAGRRVVFEEQARAHDLVAESASHEFARKVRTLAGNYQLCQLMPRLLIPDSALAFQFYSHKLMRLAAPIFFLVLLATNVIMAMLSADRSGQFFYQAALGAQLIFYAGVLAGGCLLKRNRRVRLLNFAYTFSLMNAAAFVGLVYFVFGKQNVWIKSEVRSPKSEV